MVSDKSSFEGGSFAVGGDNERTHQVENRLELLERKSVVVLVDLMGQVLQRQTVTLRIWIEKIGCEMTRS